MTIKITHKNIIAEFPKIKHLIPKELIGGFSLVEKYIEFYGDKDAKSQTDYVDTYCDMVTQWIDTNPYSDEKITKHKAETKSSKPKETPLPKTRPVKEKTITQTKPKVTKSVEDTSEKVNAISVEVTLIKRYVGLHGKTLTDKKDSATRLLSALQKAIVEQKIRKTSPYAKEIDKMQDNLIVLAGMRKSNDVIEIADYANLKDIADSQGVLPCASLIKSYISIQGKEDMKERAKNLLLKVNKFISNIKTDYPFKKELEAIQSSLEDYTKGLTKVAEISPQVLNGLYGLAGVECKCETGKPMSSVDFMGMQFDTLKFTGKWKKLIGRSPKQFKIMFYGKPSGGKSTLALQFGNYLADDHNMKVLYISKEEGFAQTLQEKIIRLDLAHYNLEVVDAVPKDMSKYDVVFFDSVNTLNLTPEQLREFDNRKSYVYIFQSTKGGSFRGSQKFEHDVDTSILVENLEAETIKNRFGAMKEKVRVL